MPTPSQHRVAVFADGFDVIVDGLEAAGHARDRDRGRADLLPTLEVRAPQLRVAAAVLGLRLDAEAGGVAAGVGQVTAHPLQLLAGLGRWRRDGEPAIADPRAALQLPLGVATEPDLDRGARAWLDPGGGDRVELAVEVDHLLRSRAGASARPAPPDDARGCGSSHPAPRIQHGSSRCRSRAGSGCRRAPRAARTAWRPTPSVAAGGPIRRSPFRASRSRPR